MRIQNFNPRSREGSDGKTAQISCAIFSSLHIFSFIIYYYRPFFPLSCPFHNFLCSFFGANLQGILCVTVIRTRKSIQNLRASPSLLQYVLPWFYNYFPDNKNGGCLSAYLPALPVHISVLRTGRCPECTQIRSSGLSFRN